MRIERPGDNYKICRDIMDEALEKLKERDVPVGSFVLFTADSVIDLCLQQDDPDDSLERYILMVRQAYAFWKRKSTQSCCKKQKNPVTPLRL